MTAHTFAAPGLVPTDHYRRVLSTVPTSVAVVAGIADAEEPVGLAVGTFTSVSLDPPLISFCPGVSSSSWPRIRPSGHFCVTVLAADQLEICDVFASKRPDKFRDLSWQKARNGSPMLDGAVAWIECELEIEHQAGDHTVAIAKVTHVQAGPAESPLVFVSGRYIGVA